MKAQLSLLFTVALIGSSSAATVLTEFSATENFPTIASVSNTDAAAGKTTLRDYAAGNFNAAVTTDGAYGTGFNNNPSNSDITPRYKIDLGSLTAVATVNSYSYQAGSVRSNQIFSLYGSASVTDPGFNEATGWTLIDSVNMTTSPQLYGASSISGINTNYQWIMWVTTKVTAAGGGEHTVWKEFDVIAVPEPSTFVLVGLGCIGLTLRRRK